MISRDEAAMDAKFGMIVTREQASDSHFVKNEFDANVDLVMFVEIAMFCNIFYHRHLLFIKRQWFSGKIRRCHRRAGGSIPS